MKNQLQKDILDLLDEQTNNWPLARSNYEALKSVKKKQISFNGFNIEIQYNPGREKSTLASVPKQETLPNDCFLCLENLPVDQKKIALNDNFVFLCNPYPIFSKHLTISSIQHTNQIICGNVATLLELSERLPDFVVFYNGAQCGASAPRHLHFQAGIDIEFPVYRDFENITQLYGELLNGTSNGLSHWKINDGLRSFSVLESNQKSAITTYLEPIFHAVEPNVNILAWCRNGQYTVCIFKREKHRPSQFYAEGDKQILVSPAAVEMAGLIVTPREQDFEKINKDDIIRIFDEVIAK